MLHLDCSSYPYPSRRKAVLARKGMVAASQPLAAQAGLEILKKGGNAIDAAIATAACLTVVEPQSNGIGGDAFALVWTKGKLHGLNSSGPSPASISIEAVKSKGFYDEMPSFGMIPVTVPGTPAAWAALTERFGKLSLRDVLEPAIRYAEEGHPSTWSGNYEQYRKQYNGPEFAAWFETFMPHKRNRQLGEIWISPNHAATLGSIAETNAESFYRGELAEKMDLFFRQHGGFLRKEDLAGFYPEWVDPICVRYRGYDVWEMPPNGQGIVALMALNMLKGFDFTQKETADTYHKQIEAIKLAFVDGKKYVTDRAKMKVHAEDFLSDSYSGLRRSLIGENASSPDSGNPSRSGTVYLAAADGEGNMISFIQSNNQGFGSGLVVPGTGIALQNRGRTFSLNPGHDNCLEPEKKTYHTIIPGFLTHNGRPIGPFGVMGGFMQPQGHIQIIMNTIDFHLNPQSALDAPRWMWMDGKTVRLEHGIPEHVAVELIRRGHEIIWVNGSLGHGEIIWMDDNGVLIGGTEPRTNGCIAAW